jgi:hypothetical protein
VKAVQNWGADYLVSPGKQKLSRTRWATNAAGTDADIDVSFMRSVKTKAWLP